jgi:hypothetical protein
VSTFLRWLSDQLLFQIARRCQHPDNMVTADALEGSYGSMELKWCRRCGAIALRNSSLHPALPIHWRRTDPNLWRGR